MPVHPISTDPDRKTTVVDCLEDFSDGAVDGAYFGSLPAPKLRQLVERLVDFYAAWRPPPAESDALRFSLATSKLLKPSLLYANSVVVQDPVFEWLVTWADMEISLGRRLGEDWADRFERAHRQQLAVAADFLAQWKALLARGWLIVSPMRFDRFYGLKANVRSPGHDDLRLGYEWESLLGFAAAGHRLTPTERRIIDAGRARANAVMEAKQDKQFAKRMMRVSAITTQDRLHAAVSEYIDGLDLANGADAKPLASTSAEWEYLLHRLRVAESTLEKEARTKLSVIPAIAASDLPFLVDLSPKDLESIRASEAAFTEWQLMLSRAVRCVESLPTEDGFADEAKGVLTEALIPAAEQIHLTTSRSRALVRNVKESAIKLGLGVALGTGAAQAGLPLNLSLGAAGLTSLVDVTVRAVLRPSSVASRQSVLARLVLTTRKTA